MVTMGPVCMMKLTRKQKLIRAPGFFLDFSPSSFRPLKAEIACSIAQIKDFFIALHYFDGFKIIEHPFFLKKAKTFFKHWPHRTWHLEN